MTTVVGAKRLGALYGGSLPEYRVFEDPRFKRWMPETLYLPDLNADSFADLDGLIVPEGTHHRQLQALAPMMRRFLDGGGTVLTFGDHPVGWLPGIDWTFRPALSDPKLTAVQPDFGFHHAVPLINEIWHHHGVLRPPAGAHSLMNTEDGMSVIYVDRVSTGGTIVVSTLDPIRHTGDTALPATTRFLELFLPWVVNDLL